MSTTERTHVDLLVDGDENAPRNVSLSIADICLQWQNLPKDSLRAMRDILTRKKSEASQPLHIGTIFGTDLHFIEREGVFSFKAIARDNSSDLFRLDLPPDAIPALTEELTAAIETWE